ncbi:MAG: hypothetical protein K6G90_09720 [Clostridia bacterium]|nr:hypothetical protein [Clostridia bacterium]
MNEDYYARKKRKLDQRSVRGGEDGANKKTAAIIVVIVAAVILIAAAAGIIVVKNLHKKREAEVTPTGFTLTMPASEMSTADPHAWETSSYAPLTAPFEAASAAEVPATVAPTTAATTAAPTTAAPATTTTTPVTAPLIEGTTKAMPVYNATSLDAEVFQCINEFRAQYGYAAYTLDAKLCTLASIRCNELVTNFSDKRPDGTDFPTIFGEYGIIYNKCGESILSGDGIDARGAVVALSRNDEDNMKIFAPTSDFDRIGVAALQNGSTYYLVILYYS